MISSKRHDPLDQNKSSRRREDVEFELTRTTTTTSRHRENDREELRKQSVEIGNGLDRYEHERRGSFASAQAANLTGSITELTAAAAEEEEARRRGETQQRDRVDDISNKGQTGETFDDDGNDERAEAAVSRKSGSRFVEDLTPTRPWHDRRRTSMSACSSPFDRQPVDEEEGEDDERVASRNDNDDDPFSDPPLATTAKTPKIRSSDNVGPTTTRKGLMIMMMNESPLLDEQRSHNGDDDDDDDETNRARAGDQEEEEEDRDVTSTVGCLDWCLLGCWRPRGWNDGRGRRATRIRAADDDAQHARTNPME